MRKMADAFVRDHAVRRSDVSEGGRGRWNKWLPSALLRAAFLALRSLRTQNTVCKVAIVKRQ